jgi:hypothetical protein
MTVSQTEMWGENSFVTKCFLRFETGRTGLELFICQRGESPVHHLQLHASVKTPACIGFVHLCARKEICCAQREDFALGIVWLQQRKFLRQPDSTLLAGSSGRHRLLHVSANDIHDAVDCEDDVHDEVEACVLKEVTQW